MMSVSSLVTLKQSRAPLITGLLLHTNFLSHPAASSLQLSRFCHRSMSSHDSAFLSTPSSLSLTIYFALIGFVVGCGSGFALDHAESFEEILAVFESGEDFEGTHHQFVLVFNKLCM